MVADTHALLWYLLDPELLSAVARDAFECAVDSRSGILVSAVTLIELVYISEKRSDSIDSATA
jgi:PIN domain nuclease of toxin-antitoxin system